MSEKYKRPDWDLLDLALVAGTVILALNNTDGWGWLAFILFVKKCL